MRRATGRRMAPWLDPTWATADRQRRGAERRALARASEGRALTELAARERRRPRFVPLRRLIWTLRYLGRLWLRPY